jgi:sorting nexin-25
MLGRSRNSATVRILPEAASLSHLFRRLVSKVRNVLEAQLPRAKPELKAPRGAEAITLRTDQRQFDSFLRSIDHMSSLLDARRLKSDIMSEIRRTRALLGMFTCRMT